MNDGWLSRREEEDERLRGISQWLATLDPDIRAGALASRLAEMTYRFERAAECVGVYANPDNWKYENDASPLRNVWDGSRTEHGYEFASHIRDAIKE